MPARILRKPGLLTADERGQLQQHLQLGEAVLGGIPGFEQVGMDARRRLGASDLYPFTALPEVEH